jgi:hypothetical protein
MRAAEQFLCLIFVLRVLVLLGFCGVEGAAGFPAVQRWR